MYIWALMGRYYLRRLQPADFAAVYELNKHCFVEGEAYTESYFAYLYADNDYHYIVLDENNNVAGYLVTVYSDDDECSDEFNAGHDIGCDPNCEKTNHKRVLAVASIGVNTKDRNRGLARTLLETLISDVNNTSEMITYLVLQVRVSNATAIRLYEKVGFVKSIGKLVGYYSHPTEDGYLMYYSTENQN